MKKFVSGNDIREVFDYLLSVKGKATSLDVKEELRKQNFYVTQEMVSDCLQENYFEWYDGQVTREFVDNHFEYYMVYEEDAPEDILEDEADENNNDNDSFIMLICSF